MLFVVGDGNVLMAYNDWELIFFLRSEEKMRLFRCVLSWFQICDIMKTTSLGSLVCGLIFGFFGMAVVSAGEPGYVWEARVYGDHLPVLAGVADDGAGRMVAGGTHGIVLVSGDHGASWTLEGARIPTGLNDLTWADGHFQAACGYPMSVLGGAVMDSQDGTQWGAVCLLHGGPFFGIASNSQCTVVVGKRGDIMRSTDGVHWKHVSPEKIVDRRSTLMDVVWTGTRFVAVGTDNAIATSPDGENWTVHELKTEGYYLNAVASNGNVIVAVGHNCLNTADCKALLKMSNDGGENWMPVDTSSYSDFSLNSVVWTGSRFVALGDPGHAMTSSNGLVWSHHYTPNTFVVFGMDWDNERLVAVGAGAGVVSTGEAAPDSFNDWRIDRAPDSEVGFQLTGVAEGSISGGTMRAVVTAAGGKVVSSDDGFESIQVHQTPSAENLTAVCTTGTSSSRFIAVGENGTILTSADGAAWTKQGLGVATNLHSVAWCRRSAGYIDLSFGIVAGENGGIWTSNINDPSVWNFQNSTTSKHLRSVADGRVLTGPPGGIQSVQSRIVAVGDEGTILISDDSGASWSQPTNTGVTADLCGVAALDHGFVAIGNTAQASMVFTSENGIEWSQRATFLYVPLTSISLIGSQIIATTSGGRIFASSDGGEHWSIRQGTDTLVGIGGSTPLSAITVLTSGRFVAVGPQMTILTSDSAPTFAEWMAAQSPPSGQNGPDDDPNHDGVSNLLACLLGIPAVAPSSAADLQALPHLVSPAPGTPLTLAIKLNPNLPEDISLAFLVSPDLTPGSWETSLPYLPGRPCGTLSLTLDDFINGNFDLELADVILPEEGNEILFVLDDEYHFARLQADLLR
jgi:photosystem II stability/assembly factor-like uncharacterized protein